MVKRDQTSKQFFPNKMAVQFNVLGSIMEDGVFSNINGCLAVTFNRDRGDVSDIKLINNLLSQASSATSLLRLLYSASTEDKETTPYFLDFHEIRLLPRKTT